MSLKQKQVFLRENILNKGFSANDFMGFLQSKKGESGLDLNNWTLEELDLTVKEFIVKMNNQESPSPSQKITDIEDYKQTQMRQNYLEQNLQLMQNEPEFIPCLTNEQTQITTTSNIQIKLSFPEKIDGGIFSKSYISYLVETDPLNFTTRKRYTDFEWLRNILATQYIGCVIPPLCKKNFNDRFTEALVSKRSRLLQKFMEGVLVHPLVRNSQALFDFISIEREEEFENKKKDYAKILAPTRVKEIKSMNGQMKISINEDKEIYLDNISDNAEINATIMKKITTAYKELIELQKNVSNKMIEIGNLWKTLYSKSMKYYDTNNTCASYSIMNKVMNGLALIEKKKN